jgi:uncharacterized protein involved in exopolysaccharide biosynthesis
MDPTFSKQDLKGILRRRKGIFLKTFLIIFIIVTGIALYLPPIYRSEVTILTENQDIPKEYVQSTVTDYVSERMQIIFQEVMRTDRLMDIIKKNKLYPDLNSTGEKLRQMKKDVLLTPVEVSIVDERTGKPLKATTAFTLSYDASDPQTAQKVADLISGLYIEEDVRRREKVATSTTEFFEKELENLKREISKNEEKISRFKAENIDNLPGSTATILQTIGRYEQEIDRINTTIRTLREKKIYLEGQIASMDPLLPVVTSEGKIASNPNERLKALRVQLIQLQSNLSDKHPDVKALRSEIAELEAQVGGNPDTSLEKVKRLQAVQSQLAKMKGELGENHPDVVKLSREADALSREVQRLGSANRARQLSEQKPDNPAYLTLRAQIYAADSEIAALLDEKNRIEDQLKDNRLKAAAAPMVEEEYNKLTLDYESANKKYQELLNKFMSAKIAQQVDLSEQGERFTISQPANLPDKPYKPNRLAIILIGLILGLGAALGLAALQENLDQSVRSTNDVESIVGTPVIATVSFFESPGHKRARRSKRLLLAFTIVLVVVCGSFIIDRFLVPLDSVWATVGDRLVEMGIPLDRSSAK